ncbi:MAG: hypothetical protein B7X90_07080 [Novosphingobium sp. 17-62-19]|uniref:acyltransferase family protein n=1 Tax=Novosphingobium sp. 17-62-19 TaxID=1970406 RepID=UPI000BC78E9C|nr:acyltransferase [Novosphingobium sp. 17-62-19]OYX95345.1 MAG: hypothetical protein B7Y74_04555 [Novosphingobium sp. 35-62-5]OZA20100.1 MAG: hypothetical protein B7X90_07080 [Novosphingobium sp. 17-62-19]HQS96783.1 acyltransferase [Novosphingobium sp.]
MDTANGDGGASRKTQSIGGAFALNNNRGPGFDTVRILAASCVVFHHSLAIKYDIVAVDHINHFSHGYTNLGFLSVCVFFALSGFLVTPGLIKTGDIVGYLSRRLMRIMPLLLVVVAFTALVVGPLTSSLPIDVYYSDEATWRYFRNLTTWLSLQLPGVADYDGGDTINGPMWTLHYEWICYLLLALLQFFAIVRKRQLFLTIWLVSVAVSAFVFFVDGPSEARLLRLFELTSYFGAGALIFLYRDRLPWSWGIMALTLALLIGALTVNLGVILAPALVAYLVVGMGMAQFPWARLLSKGDVSYGIYLTHSVVFVLIMHFMPARRQLRWPVERRL